MSDEQTIENAHRPTPEPGVSETNTAPGLVVGGRGGPEDELLEDGQEEVFSRAEVELGKIEHKSEAGGGSDDPAPFGRPS